MEYHALLVRSVLCCAIIISAFSKSCCSEYREAPDESRQERIQKILNVATVQKSLERFNDELREWKHKSAVANWNFETNITRENREKYVQVSMAKMKWYLGVVEEAKQFVDVGLPNHLKRQLNFFLLTASTSNQTLSGQQSSLQSRMQAVYGSAKACLSSGQCLPLDPGLNGIMEQSRDPEVLKEAWSKWRDAVGPQIRQNYVDYVAALNAGAREHGFSDYSQFWKQNLFHDTPNLNPMLESLWKEVQPLYMELHAYVRRKLRDQYGSDVVGNDGAIPAHLLGNMWSQQWRISDIVSPFPEVNEYDQIEARLKRKYGVKGMFREAEAFYKSIGLYPMTSTFWRKSMLTRPEGREVVCHGSAFDMLKKGDFRIKMCTTMTLEDFNTIHHEMGHVEYYMAYENQPTIFREGANSAFHEAIGDTIQLSVLSRTHMARLKLLPLNEQAHKDEEIMKEFNSDNIIDELKDKPLEEVEKRENSAFLRVPRKPSVEEKLVLNSLMTMALEKIAFLPFGLLVDKWRWGVFSGEISSEDYNREWWKLRLQYQGIVSPVPRSEKDFDPGAKYHIPAHSAYVIYFVSHIQEFQMYKALCDEAGYTGPLYLCDFYGSKKAGHRLKSVMSLGSSVPWQAQLLALTGNNTVSAQPILEYFRPLYQWLKADNLKHGEKPGWEDATINWES